jgi:hypothetical protein
MLNTTSADIGKMRKKIIALLLGFLVLAIVYYTFFGAGLTFEKGLRQIKSIDEKYGIKKDMFVPADANETANYTNELKALKANLESAAESKARSALVLLVESRIYAVYAQTNMFYGAYAYKRISRVKYECKAGETAMVAKDYFENARESAHKALSMRSSFVESYRDFADAAGIEEKGLVELALQSISQSSDEIVKSIDAYCPK